MNPVGPVLDGDLLTGVPWLAGGGRDVDLLAGHTRDEARLFLAMTGQLGTVTDADAAALLDDLAPDAGAYRAAYPDAGAERLYETVYSDALLRMPTILLAEAHAAAGGTTFAFELTWEAPGLGAAHGIDVPLLFGSYDSPAGGLLLGEPTEEIRALGDQLRRSWTAFAEHGDPGWPRFTGRGGLTRIFDGAQAPVVTGYPEERSRSLWTAKDATPFALPDYGSDVTSSLSGTLGPV